ncbi:MAG: FHA domain-containing protein [Bacteroidota bacterium]
MAADRPDLVAALPLRVASGGETWTFDRAFTVGRVPPADVVLDNSRVSRAHLEIAPRDGGWHLRDLDSSNGTIVDGERVTEADVTDTIEVQVGDGGPMLLLAVGTGQSGDTTGPAGDAVLTGDEDPFRPADEAPAADRDLQDAPPPAGDGPAVLPGTPASEDHTTGEVQTPAGRNPADADGDGELSYNEVVDRYFGEGAEDEEVGERTRFIRQAYQDLQKQQEEVQTQEVSRWRLALLAAVGVGVIALAYAGFLQYRAVQYRATAQELFYQLKTFEVNIAQQEVALQEQIEANPNGATADSLTVELERAREIRQQTASRYDRFVRDLGVYDGLSSQEEAIYRTARAFGESELAIPPGFLDEVMPYIRGWSTNGRFQRAVRHAQVNGFDTEAVNALRRHGMPLEFFYLVMQESNFDTRAVGPPTRYGHAKGAWQFIPETGRRYGLETGPLVATGQFDPQDERHDFRAAADAGARYLRDIYVTLAQASGLLVAASYNWGEGNIRSNMRQLQRGPMQGIANNPENRTYWKFLTTYRSRMPSETKDYVMKIFSAAVVGQNPRLFGIDMDPPTRTALSRTPGGIRETDTPSGGRTTRLGGSSLDQRRASDDAPTD